MKKLFIPGPVDVLPEILEEMSTPIISHRKQECKDLTKEIVEGIGELLYTKNLILLSPSSSSGLMEGAVRNTTARKCLNVINGAFSKRWYNITLMNGIPADAVECDWGTIVPIETIEEYLSTGKYDSIAVCHNETSTCVAYPLEEIGKIARENDVMFLVDAVSSAGGMKIDVDRLGIDVLVFGVQKALGLPPGLAFGSVSEAALEKASTIKYRGYYFDFLELKKYIDRYQNPATPPLSIMFAARAQLHRILRVEGLENRFKRHTQMADLTRGWAKKNFELFADERYTSNTVTGVINNRDLDLEELSKKLEERGYVFSNGYGPLKNKMFRIAHMAYRTQEELETYLEVLEEIMDI